jgi:hypothetical protein
MVDPLRDKKVGDWQTLGEAAARVVRRMKPPAHRLPKNWIPLGEAALRVVSRLKTVKEK